MLKQARLITKKLNDAGYEAYVVGGALRDIFTGYRPSDIDIATNATVNELEYIFKDHKINTVGKSFHVVIIDGIDVATYRSDIYFGGSDKNSEICVASSIEKDLARRDLTINAIAYNPEINEFIDPYYGVSDLNLKVIRFVGDAKKRIHEDPCRIIRACRFLAKIEGTFAYSTFEALREYSYYVKQYVAPERIEKEIQKVLTYKKPSIFFNALRRTGVLEYIFSTLNECYGFDGGDHHKETVFNHCMDTGDNISCKYPLLRLTGYLHDAAKVKVYQEKDDHISFIGHEDSCIVAEELKKLKFSSKDISYIMNLIKVHMRGLAPDTSPKAVRKLLRYFNENNIYYKDFLRLRIADTKSNRKRDKLSYSEIRCRYQKFIDEFNRPEQVIAKSDLAVNGHDIMAILDMKPGKSVGEVLKILNDIVLDNPELNTYETLVEILKE